MSALATLAKKEFRDAMRGDWLLVYAVLFALLALGIAYLGQRNLGGIGFQGFSRTTASLLNLSLLLTPLVGLAAGAGAIAGMRERGSLTYLLSQPVRPWEVLVGKFAGQVAAVALATSAGFGLAGVVIAVTAPSMSVALYATLLVLVIALTAVMVAIGLVASVLTENRGQAMGLAIVAWFMFVLFFDLILIGLVSQAGMGGGGLLAGLLANPVEVVRVLLVVHLEPDLDALGPFGSYMLDTLGRSGTTALLVAALAAWVAAPLTAGAFLFQRRGE